YSDLRRAGHFLRPRRRPFAWPRRAHPRASVLRRPDLLIRAGEDPRQSGEVSWGINYSGMRRRILGTILCTVAAASAQTAPDFTKPAGAEWPLVGGDWGNTRYSTLDKLNPSNVKTLK